MRAPERLVRDARARVLRTRTLRVRDGAATAKHLTQLSKRLSPDAPHKVLVVVNPAGGTGRAQKVFERDVAPVFYAANIEADVVVTKAQGDAMERCRLVAAAPQVTYDGVVVVGGDGTLSEVVRGLADGASTLADPEQRLRSYKSGALPRRHGQRLPRVRRERRRRRDWKCGRRRLQRGARLFVFHGLGKVRVRREAATVHFLSRDGVGPRRGRRPWERGLPLARGFEDDARGHLVHFAPEAPPRHVIVAALHAAGPQGRPFAPSRLPPLGAPLPPPWRTERRDATYQLMMACNVSHVDETTPMAPAAGLDDGAIHLVFTRLRPGFLARVDLIDGFLKLDGGKHIHKRSFQTTAAPRAAARARGGLRTRGPAWTGRPCRRARSRPGFPWRAARLLRGAARRGADRGVAAGARGPPSRVRRR